MRAKLFLNILVEEHRDCVSVSLLEPSAEPVEFTETSVGYVFDKLAKYVADKMGIDGYKR